MSGSGRKAPIRAKSIAPKLGHPQDAPGGGGGVASALASPASTIHAQKILPKEAVPQQPTVPIPLEEWNFGAIPPAALKAAMTFEYLRESATLRRFISNHNRFNRGFQARPNEPHTIVDIWGEFPQDCANWNFLEDHPEILDDPWLKLSQLEQKELGKLWRTNACKIVSWYELANIINQFEKSTLEDWPDTHVHTEKHLAHLRQMMEQMPTTRILFDHQEIVAFRLDWTRFTADEVAEEMARQFKAVFTRPRNTPPLSQKPLDDAVSLRNLAIARLRKALQPGRSGQLSARLKSSAAIDSEIKRMAIATGYELLANASAAVFRNNQRDVQRTFLRLHPYLVAGGAAGLKSTEIPACLLDTNTPNPSEK
jgi:hypothetical protein